MCGTSLEWQVISSPIGSPMMRRVGFPHLFCRMPCKISNAGSGKVWREFLGGLVSNSIWLGKRSIANRYIPLLIEGHMVSIPSSCIWIWWASSEWESGWDKSKPSKCVSRRIRRIGKSFPVNGIPSSLRTWLLEESQAITCRALTRTTLPPGNVRAT